MFDISIGTMIPAMGAETIIPQLNAKGFESYTLDFNCTDPETFDFEGYAEKVLPVLDGRKISCLGYYKNPILNEQQNRALRRLIQSAKYLNCDTIGTFAGGDPSKSVPDTIPAFKATWEPIAALAEECGVRIGFEGCGGGWNGGSTNIGFCPASWELMFEAVPSKALGLEWEPAHAVTVLADPVAQVRTWADRVVHIHGKDGTVGWDVIEKYGINGGQCFAWERTPGFGDTNWTNVFTVLLQHGFEGACDIEGYHDTVHYDDMEWSAQLTALEFLKRCRGGVEYFPGPVEYRGFQGTRKKK